MKENLIFLALGIFMLIIYIFAESISADPCLEDAICPEGTYREACPPCWDKPCTFTKEFCDENGGYWIEEYRTCNMNIITTSKKHCLLAGGEWKSGCSFKKKCGIEE